MIRSFFLILLLSLNLSAENNEEALKESLLKFWEARNARDFEKIFFYESKIGAITGSSSGNHFYEDPPPDFESVLDYYSRVESDVTPSNIRIIKLSENVYLTLYYLTVFVRQPARGTALANAIWGNLPLGGLRGLRAALF